MLGSTSAWMGELLFISISISMHSIISEREREEVFSKQERNDDDDDGMNVCVRRNEMRRITI